MSERHGLSCPPPTKRLKCENSERHSTDLEVPKSAKTEGGQTQSQIAQTSDSKSFFNNQKIFILQTGIGKARTDLFRKQIINNGGTYLEKLASDTNYIIVDENMEIGRMCRILKLDTFPEESIVVKSLWLSSCLKHRRLVDALDYKLSTVMAKSENVIGTKEKDSVSKVDSPAPGNSNDTDIKYRPYKQNKRLEGEISGVESDYEQSGGEDDALIELDDTTAAAAPKRPLPVNLH